MAQKRGKFKGRKRGGRRRSRRPARVVDPGLFYALRACVALLLHLYSVRKLTDEQEKALANKLSVWYTEANAWWETDVPLHERAELGPDGEVAPGEGSSAAGRARTVHVPRKRGSPPRWDPAKGLVPSEDEELDEEAELT